jgi:hypothetical protein
MPKVSVYVSVAVDRELRAAGLDPAEIVRDAARKGVAQALDAVRTGTPTPAPRTGHGPSAPSATLDPRLRRRPTPTLDAVGVSTTATTGKIGVAVVPAADVDDPLADAGRQ